MADTDRTENQPRAQLFDELDAVSAGMLGVKGASSALRPMTHFADAKTATLWFITSRKTDLATEIGQGNTALYCLINSDNGFYASLRGAVRASEDSEKLDEIWNVVASAWFSGRDDPDLMLVEMSLREAELWSSTDSGFHFGLEIAKANLDSDATPDVGAHAAVRF